MTSTAAAAVFDLTSIPPSTGRRRWTWQVPTPHRRHDPRTARSRTGTRTRPPLIVMANHRMASPAWKNRPLLLHVFWSCFCWLFLLLAAQLPRQGTALLTTPTTIPSFPRLRPPRPLLSPPPPSSLLSSTAAWVPRDGPRTRMASSPPSSSSSSPSDGDTGEAAAVPELTAGNGKQDDDDDVSGTTAEATGGSEVDVGDLNLADSSTTAPPALWKRVVSMYKRGAGDGDGLTFRQRLAKAGMSVVLSYGFVSNMSYCVSVSAAWYIFCKRTALSPLAPGQRPRFLAVYSGFWVFNNIVRPIRFAASVALSTKFDAIVRNIQERANVSRRVAIGLTVVLANVVGTTMLMCAGVALAASLAGVPIFPPKG